MTIRTKLALALSLALGTTTAFAADNASMNKSYEAQPILLVGYAFGGDEVGSLDYDDGSSSDVTSGGGFTFGGGIDIAFDSDKIGLPKPIGVQATAAYKFDSATADNADVTFDRFEFTLLPYVKLNDKVSLGLGIAFHTGVELTAEFDGAGTDTVEFDTGTALVAEVAYEQSPQLKWSLRYSSIDYSVSKVNGTDVSDFDLEDIDGSNIGAFMVYRFDQ